MPSLTTEGIVLKHSNFGEADRILTILTPFKGKIKVIAKGVRRITSRRAGNIEPLNLVKIQLFQGRGLMILTEAQSIQTFPQVKSDLITSAYGSHIVEIADRLLPEDQPNSGAYKLVAAVLTLLNKHPRQLFIRAYEIKLLSELGFWSTREVQGSPALLELLQKLQRSSWEQISELKIDPPQALELERVLRYYLEKVLEGPLRSIQVIEKLKRE